MRQGDRTATHLAPAVTPSTRAMMPSTVIDTAHWCSWQHDARNEYYRKYEESAMKNRQAATRRAGRAVVQIQRS
jgi:hypothetical protein